MTPSRLAQNSPSISEPPFRESEVFDARDLRYAFVNTVSTHPNKTLLCLITALFGCWEVIKRMEYYEPVQYTLLLASLALTVFLFGFVSAVWIVQSHLAKRTALFRRHQGSVVRADARTLGASGQPCLDIVEQFLAGVREHLALTTQQIGALEDQNAHLREQYELLTNNLGASVLLVDRHRTIHICSPYTEILTGYPPEDVQNRGLDALKSIIREGDKERFERAWQVAELGEDILVRYQVRHLSGLQLWLETRLVPVHDVDGVVTAILLVTIDVTDSLNYQRQVEEQNRDLSDFTSMVSHDLKAPIFTIKGMAAALLEDLSEKLGTEGTEQLQHILEAGTRLEKLVSSVLAYSKVTSGGTPETNVKLEVVLQSVMKDLSSQIHQADAGVVLSANLPLLRGDPLGFYQIFSNLIVNSLKYASPERKPVISINSFQKEPTAVEITVSDNGLGIPDGKLEEIFRPFKRLHSHQIEGSGIGLACVKKLTERFGGTIHATSIEGVSTTIHLLFPVTPQCLDRESVSQAPSNLGDAIGRGTSEELQGGVSLL